MTLTSNNWQIWAGFVNIVLDAGRLAQPNSAGHLCLHLLYVKSLKTSKTEYYSVSYFCVKPPPFSEDLSQYTIIIMDKPRVRKNHNRRFDSLQYLKLAVHNSWKLTPKVAAAKNIESKNDIYKNNSSSSSPATRNTRETDFAKKSLDGVDNKIKATMANGCTFYYSVQDTVIKNDFGDEDSDDEDDEDVITDHLSKSGYEIIPGSDSLENRVSGIINK